MLHFEIMCDASNYAVRAVLPQRVDKAFCVIYYASMTLDFVQSNYTTTEKELLAIAFALDKFRSYLLGSKVTVFLMSSFYFYMGLLLGLLILLIIKYWCFSYRCI